MPAVSPLQIETSRARQGSGSTATELSDALRSANLANYYLRTALDQSTEGVLILRPSQDASLGPKVIYNNSRMTLFTGVDPRSGLRGTNLRDLLISDEDFHDLMTALHNAYLNGGGGEWQGALKSFFGQSHELFHWRIRAVQNEFGLLQNYTLIISPVKTAPAICPDAANHTDSDEIIKDDIRRLRNDQLAAMSQGVLHDLNNLLGIIMTNLSAISTAGTSDAFGIDSISGQTAHHIKEALDAAVQAREFTSQTLRLTKDLPATREPVDVAHLVKTATRIAQSGSGVKLHMHLPNELWWTIADRTSIAQVIQNLVINAIQAMDNTGNMEIRAKNVVAPADHSLLQPGPHVEISVRDCGCGMAPDVLERVMKESYTTKANGHGIGLATCRRVIEEHGGKMHISSLFGVGTEVFIWLPACQPPRKELSTPSEQTEQLRSGVGSILVVDDEDRLRQITVTVLTKCGYQVYEAQDGVEAIDIYRRLMRQNQEVDLVIMDLTLKGGLSGEEALQGIKQLNPEAKVVASSGGLVSQSKDHYVQLGFCDILPKPYLSPDIAKLVHQWVMTPRNGK